MGMTSESIDAMRHKMKLQLLYSALMQLRIFTLAMAFLCSSLFGTEVYFSPSVDCENRIVRAIDESQSNIAVAVYSINNKKIVDALLAAKKRGVKLRVLTDNTQASQRSSRVLEMVANGVDLRVHSKFKIEHNKFGVYDGKLVSTGSFNWTGPAARSNSENCLFLDDKSVISKFHERFEFLWSKNSAEASKVRLAKLQQRNAASVKK